MRFVFNVLLLIAAMKLVDGACKLSGNKLKKVTNNFQSKCLKKGYESSLPGCQAEGESKLSKKQAKKCAKNEKKLVDCDICAVDGEWGHWGQWSTCSEECGGGQRTRDRNCDNPEAAFGGEECSGDNSQSQSCNEQECDLPYTITFTTGEGRWHDSKGDLQMTVVGTSGKTDDKVCSGDKNLGATDECVVESSSDIGQVTSVIIENLSDDYWAFTAMEIRLGDKLVARMEPKTVIVDDYKTVNVPLTAIGVKPYQYKIVHTTATDKWAGGAGSGYMFTVIGSDGRTDSYNCEADRGLGAVSGCEFEDFGIIGRIESVTIENTTDDWWKFSSLTVNGVDMETGAIDDYLTINYGRVN